MMNEAWQRDGFCVPNPGTYSFQWLWDSCFHSLIWAELGDDRALVELDSTLAHQGPTGFVPHVTYWAEPSHHASFWSQPLTSTITQPPMFGHTAAALSRAGLAVSQETFERCRRGLAHLLNVRPRHPSGLIPVLHPWETGCDDSLRWDDWRGRSSWFQTKGDLVEALVVTDGVALGSTSFSVASAGFNALVAWNIAELDSVGQAGDLADQAKQLSELLADQWDAGLATWVDAGNTGSGRIRTLDGMLGLLVDPREAGFDQLRTGGGYAAPYGPRGVHEGEPAYDPDTYWRGPAWPQLSYLCIQAASQAGERVLAEQLHECLTRSAEASELSEYWNPDTGTGRGAQPQSWTGLSILPLPTQSR